MVGGGAVGKAVNHGYVVTDGPGCGQRTSERPQGGQRVRVLLPEPDQVQAPSHGRVIIQLSAEVDQGLSISATGGGIGP